MLFVCQSWWSNLSSKGLLRARPHGSMRIFRQMPHRCRSRARATGGSWPAPPATSVIKAPTHSWSAGIAHGSGLSPPHGPPEPGAHATLDPGRLLADVPGLASAGTGTAEQGGPTLPSDAPAAAAPSGATAVRPSSCTVSGRGIDVKEREVCLARDVGWVTSETGEGTSVGLPAVRTAQCSSRSRFSEVGLETGVSGETSEAGGCTSVELPAVSSAVGTGHGGWRLPIVDRTRNAHIASISSDVGRRW